MIKELCEIFLNPYVILPIHGEKKSDNGMLFKIVDQSVTRSISWQSMLDKISLEIRTSFLDVRATEKFPGKMVDCFLLCFE